MMAFKFLAKGAIGPISGFAWQRGVWIETSQPLALCSNGIHVLRTGDLSHWLHEELWRIETEGTCIEGFDCLVAPRARLLERVDRWTDGGGVQFARACHTRLQRAVAQTTDPALGDVLSSYLWAVGRHVETRNAAMAGYVTAMGLGKLEPADYVSRFRKERDWQSAWIAREFELGS